MKSKNIRLLLTCMAVTGALSCHVTAYADAIPSDVVQKVASQEDTGNLYDVEENEAYIQKVCDSYNLPTSLVKAVIETESHFDPSATSSSGCRGLMQISPKWHKDRTEKLGLTVDDLYDGNSNILIGCDYLSELLDTYGDTALALMVYNQGGKSAVEQYHSTGISEYALKVLSAQEHYR